ncbi:hypothetical protein DL764_008603 [Monosporascus ibericus]|uniref:Calcineurin-like phosphoesterase domain-containing protein n=1 Tax=Monosporascus ibericus TaxID=155417 RepID=A0A4Q4SZB6_9PEZI|nr:hypothetical protein DL764_008603 [Monosporascus ibericus]
MIAIQFLSGLHLEAPRAHDVFETTPRAPYLVLLGDIGNMVRDREKYTGFLLKQLSKFEAVPLVPGNLEPDHSSWPATRAALEQFGGGVRAQKCLGAFAVLDPARFDITSSSGDEDEEVVAVIGCRLSSHVPPEAPTPHTRPTERGSPRCSGASQRTPAAGEKGEVKVVLLTHYRPTTDSCASDSLHRGSVVSVRLRHEAARGGSRDFGGGGGGGELRRRRRDEGGGASGFDAEKLAEV